MATEVVQFTRDLRVEDHGGLLKASQADAWLPVYCGTDCDDARVARALKELDAELRERYDAPLRIVKGLAVSIADVARSVGAGVVHVCADDPAYATQDIREALGDTLRTWTAPLRDAQVDPELDFDYYALTLGRASAPEAAPDTMPPLASTNLDGVDTLQPQPSKEAPWADVSTSFCGCRSALAGVRSYLTEGRGPFADRHFAKPPPTSLYAASLAWVVGDGTPSERLAYREPASRAFSEALALGCLSVREAHELASQQGALPLSRTKGKGWPVLSARTATAFSEVVENGEYHRLLAASGGPRSAGDSWFRWEGHLCRMKTLRGTPSEHAPTFVAVHGFGASANQWERLAGALPASVEHVVAVELLGFGLSAKPGVSYTQHLWERYVSDALAMIAGPVVLCGNSIGGGLCAGVSANYPGKVAGLVLCNTAGSLLDEEQLREKGALDVAARTLALDLEPYAGPPQVLLDVFGEAVIAGLRPQIPVLLKKYYDTNPDNADAQLAAAISRDARDPGAANVIGSGAKLPPQISLNEDFSKFAGPVLVPQGSRDAVTGSERAVQRADDLAKLRPGITVRKLVSGHCPHDETPDLVAAAIQDWWPKAVKRAGGLRLRENRYYVSHCPFLALAPAAHRALEIVARREELGRDHGPVGLDLVARGLDQRLDGVGVNLGAAVVERGRGEAHDVLVFLLLGESRESHF